MSRIQVPVWIALAVLAVLGLVALGIWFIGSNPGSAPQAQTAGGPEKQEPDLKELLLQDLEGWNLVSEGPSEAAPREEKGKPPVPSWSAYYCREPEGCEAKVIGLSIALFRFSSVEVARKWLGQARYRAQQNAPYQEAFEVGDFQSDYDLVPGFEGEEGFYLADEEKAKGKELWLRLYAIVIVMHSGMGTDLLGLARRQGEKVIQTLDDQDRTVSKNLSKPAKEDGHRNLGFLMYMYNAISYKLSIKHYGVDFI